MKKAQGGMNAAILIAIIAGLIILYIVFIPESDRNRILNNETGPGGEPKDSLLKVSPGLLGMQNDLENEKQIPNIFLVETTDAAELESINPFVVKDGLFDEKTKTEQFTLDDLENTDNVILAFSAKEREGALIIKLNGETIFESELSSNIVSPIRLAKSRLQKENTLEFSVSSPGAAFWKTNEYSLENVKIIGDITDSTRQESTNLFTISDSELQSLDKGTLKFIPYCGDVTELGLLEVYINNRKLFSSVPICDQQYKQSIPKSMLNEGENNIVFKTSKGVYSVEQISVAMEFKSPRLRTYYFEISEDQFNNIRSGADDAQITLKFVEDNKIKRAKLDINGHLETVDTDKLVFTKNINSKVSEGNNFVRIEPFDELEVLELRIDLT